MNPLADESAGTLRRLGYLLLIIAAAGVMTGRVMSVKSKRGKTPLLSANDRSRWCTIRGLVDYGTYRIDRCLFTSAGNNDPEWFTIDLVRHKGRDGREHYYSSKPPLLPTLLAGKYWLVKQLTGATLVDAPFYVVRCLLLTTNVFPLVLYFVLLARLVDRLGVTSWGRLFVMTAATWGTFLTTFSVTINNHVPAAIAVLITVYAVLPVLRGEETRLRYFFMAGAAAAFTTANELPALSFLAVIAAVMLWRSPRKTLVGFVPGAAAVAIAFFLTTYVAHQSWRPPYAHRSDGPVVATLPKAAAEPLDPAKVLDDLRSPLEASGFQLSSEATITPSHPQGRWVLWDPATQNRLALIDAGQEIQVRQWDNWYDYEISYWTPDKKRGVDRGEPKRSVYAFHVLLGHRGVFSLTPIWLLSVAGIGIWLRRGDMTLRGFAAMVAVLTVVCLGFYIMREQHDRNYGGVSCGFRWMFWFTPLWLICLVPTADAVSLSRVGRVMAWACLFVSVVSASYASLNPWSHSWIFDYWTYVQWIQY